MTHLEHYFSANQKIWDTRTPLHVASDFYDVQAFIDGKSSLTEIEVNELGDIRDRDILHLQCHFGMDTLSLARLGARVTGVDFSAAAIRQARQLAEQTNLNADFHCCNVYEVANHVTDTFDIVFTSYGVLGWLPDLRSWARIVTDRLRPGGFLYLLEFHPHYSQLDDNGNVAYQYFHSTVPDEDLNTVTYADRAEHEPLPDYWWNHTLGDVINALIEAGLNLHWFREFPFSTYRLSEAMEEQQPGRWVFPGVRGQIPYEYSIRAERPE